MEGKNRRGKKQWLGSTRVERMLVTPFKGPFSLCNVSLDSWSYLQERFLGVIEYSLTSPLPKIPTCVNHQTIEALSFFFCDLGPSLLPPCAEASGVLVERQLGVKVLQDRIWFHTSLVNGHSRDRCKHVSKGPLHSTSVRSISVPIWLENSDCQCGSVEEVTGTNHSFLNAVFAHSKGTNRALWVFITKIVDFTNDQCQPSCLRGIYSRLLSFWFTFSPNRNSLGKLQS